MLGCKVETEPLTPGDACTGATLKVGALVEAYGGDMLCGIVLTQSMFAAEVMEAGGGVPFESMKVAQLKEGACKAWLDADRAQDGAAAALACNACTGGDRAVRTTNGYVEISRYTE